MAGTSGATIPAGDPIRPDGPLSQRGLPSCSSFCCALSRISARRVSEAEVSEKRQRLFGVPPRPVLLTVRQYANRTTREHRAAV
jgi:hypothetical protein